MGEFIYYTKQVRPQQYNSAIQSLTPIRLLPTVQGRKIIWNNNGDPQGRWEYNQVQHGSTVREELCLKFSGRTGAPLKEHYFHRITNTDTWELITEKGTHFNPPFDTVMLIKVHNNGEECSDGSHA